MPRRPVPVAETKAQKFERLANLRTNLIRKLGSLSNKNHYDYSEDEVQRIFHTIEGGSCGRQKPFPRADETRIPLICDAGRRVPLR
jgi:hypothetical protein